MDHLANRHKGEFLYKIEQATGEYINSLGYELVEASFSKTKGALIVRFLIDKPTGGISIEECSRLNKGLSELLERENIIEGRYVLEVSSPGVDRPLIAENDFLRVLGRRVRIYLREPLKKKWEIEGIVQEVKKECVFVRQGNQVMDIPLLNIKKAKQEIL